MQYWQMVREFTAPVVMALQRVDQAARDRITAKVVEEPRRRTNPPTAR